MTGILKEIQGNRLVIEMAASLENIDLAASQVSDILEERFPGVKTFGLILGLREALTNAVVHGSGQDGAKKVSCRVEFGAEAIDIEVADSGDGFRWKEMDAEIPDPSLPGRRGLAIIRNYFDSCKYNEKGNIILLTKRNLC